MRATLRLHIENVGRALVVPVPEARVAGTLKLQDILFPEGGRKRRRKKRQKRSEGERAEGRREEEEMEGRKN